MMIEVRWHGRGGQGCWTVARLLGLAATQFEGKYALAFPSFGPERRGAPVLGFTRISDHKIHDRSEVKSCDYIVVLDETLIDESICGGLKENGIVIINSNYPEKHEKYLQNVKVKSVDATSIALELLGRTITNTAMLGALVALSDVVSLDSVDRAIKQELKDSVYEKNVKVVKRAYEALREEE